MAKPKTKAAVKRMPAKTPARAAAPPAAKAPKKAAPAKSAGKPAKVSAVKPSALKASTLKPSTAKPSTVKPGTLKVAKMPSKAAPAIAPDVEAAAKPRMQEKVELLTLPTARQAEVPVAKPAPVPVPVVRKIALSVGSRADLPPADGFTLLVDGHFKSQFGDLKGAKAAASELKGRFPMLRVEIYDAANKARLPA